MPNYLRYRRRDELGQSTLDFARQTGFAVSYFVDIERGYARPRHEDIDTLASVYGLSPLRFMEITGAERLLLPQQAESLRSIDWEGAGEMLVKGIIAFYATLGEGIVFAATGAALALQDFGLALGEFLRGDTGHIDDPVVPLAALKVPETPLFGQGLPEKKQQDE